MTQPFGTGAGALLAMMWAALSPLSAQELPALRAPIVAEGVGSPLFVTAPPGDPRVFILDQTGRIYAIGEGGEPIEFLDIRDQTAPGGERGLLGLAFHPAYASNGRFFVNYTDRSGDTRVVEYAASGADRDRADPNSAKPLLHIPQPAGNHNGGWLGFGPDGLLYIAQGDGGGAGDRYNNGQNRDSLLGALLRIDVDAGDPYAIPDTNPFAGGGGAPEIFAYGLRNPWRVSFDGDKLYIADVGQNGWEEISVIGTDDAGANLGWPIMEGSRCYRPANCDPSGLVLPIEEYGHSGSDCSITGGYVYRGDDMPGLVGHYFYGDYCSGAVRSFRYADGEVSERTDWTAQLGNLGNITSFGRDAGGEVYITVRQGRVYRLTSSN